MSTVGLSLDGGSELDFGREFRQINSVRGHKW